MKSNYVILAAVAFLFVVSSLFESGGQNGKIGELTNTMISKAEQKEAAPASPQPSLAAAKVNPWSQTDDAEQTEEDSLWSQPDNANSDGGKIGGSLAGSHSRADIRPIQPVFASAGPALLPEQTALRER